MQYIIILFYTSLFIRLFIWVIYFLSHEMSLSISFWQRPPKWTFCWQNSTALGTPYFSARSTSFPHNPCSLSQFTNCFNFLGRSLMKFQTLPQNFFHQPCNSVPSKSTETEAATATKRINRNLFVLFIIIFLF